MALALAPKGFDADEELERRRFENAEHFRNTVEAL